MADDECKRLLESWNLGTLVKRFEDNGIDENTLKKLTATLIKELIPEIGLRIKFTLKWEEQFANVIELPDQGTSQQFDDTDTTISVSDLDSNKENNDTSETRFRKLKRPHVKEILKKSMEGSAVLKAYQKSHILSRKCRNIIVDVIVSEILKSHHRYGPFRNEDFECVTKEIIQTFPAETPGTYYVPAIKKKHSRTHKSITSRGKLIDKYRNKIREYRRLTGCNLLNDDSSSTSTSVGQSNSDIPIEEDIETINSVSWLQKNQAPWELVVSNWTATSKFRRNEIENLLSHDVAAIFARWPILRHPMGHVLIDEDFKFLNLSKEANAISNWQIFFDKIQKLCPMKKDKKTNELYELLKAGQLNDDTKVAVQLSLLSYLIPPKGRIRTKKEHWKPSINECKDSMIIHAKIPGDVSSIQAKRIDVMNNMKLKLQPYIIIVGPSLQELTTFYVCIDQTLYKISSVLNAIDICFKSFHVLDAFYPPESEHLWHLIQHGLYNFSTKHDKQISYIAEIIHMLQNPPTSHSE